MFKPAAGKYPYEIIRFVGNQIHTPLDVTIIPGRTLGDLVENLFAVHVDIYMHCNKCGGDTGSQTPDLFDAIEALVSTELCPHVISIIVQNGRA